MAPKSPHACAPAPPPHAHIDIRVCGTCMRPSYAAARARSIAPKIVCRFIRGHSRVRAKGLAVATQRNAVSAEPPYMILCFVPNCHVEEGKHCERVKVRVSWVMGSMLTVPDFCHMVIVVLRAGERVIAEASLHDVKTAGEKYHRRLCPSVSPLPPAKSASTNPQRVDHALGDSRALRHRQLVVIHKAHVPF